MAKVLIIDDSSLGRKLINRIITNAGHEVIAEAENGEEGILAYKRIKPEIVTMDVDMPGINGLEASKRILEDHHEARIIIISAHEQNDLKVEMDKYGLKYYIIKPVTIENVKSVFQKALKDAGNNVAKKAPNTVTADKASEAKVSIIKVSVGHHSVINIFVAAKTGEEGKTLLLEIEKETPFNDFAEEDPIVVGYESNGVHILSQGEISEVDTVKRALKVEIINSTTLEVETTYQNIPASTYIDIRVLSTRKRYPAIIKTFMVNEIVFMAKEDFDKDEKVSFDIFQRNSLLSIDGRIISKTQGKKNIEYSIKLDFDDYNIKRSYIAYMQELASHMENSIEHMSAKF